MQQWSFPDEALFPWTSQTSSVRAQIFSNIYWGGGEEAGSWQIGPEVGDLKPNNMILLNVLHMA